MKVFVAGGAGYIGSIVTQQLLDAGHQVTVYDSLIKGHRQAVPAAASLSWATSSIERRWTCP